MSQLFKLKNGTVLLSTEAPGGVYNSAQLKKIADLCSKELAVVKATEDQRLALFVKDSEVPAIIEQLRAIGLGIRNYQEGLHQPLSCLGELCEDHEQPALTTAMDLTRELAAISLQSSLKIGINGCARCCTPCHTLDISILGEPSGYRVSLGGKTSQFPELSSFFAEGIPSKELPRLIKSVVALFKKQAEPGESLHDVLERCGVTEYVRALSPYSQDAAGRDDPFAADASGEESESLAADDVPLEASPEADHLDLGDDSASPLAPSDDALDEISIEDPDDLSLDTELDEGLSLDDAASPSSPASSADEENLSLEDDAGLSLDGMDDGVSLESPEDSEFDASEKALAPDADLDLADDLDLETAKDGESELSLEGASGSRAAAAGKNASAQLEDELDMPLEQNSELSLDEDQFSLDPIGVADSAEDADGVDPLDDDGEIEIEASGGGDEALEAALRADDLSLDDEPGIDDLSLGQEEALVSEPTIAAPAARQQGGSKTAPTLERDLSEISELEDDVTLGDQDEGKLEEIPIRDEDHHALGDDLAAQDADQSQSDEEELEAIEGASDLELLEKADESPAPLASQAAAPESQGIDAELDEAIELEAVDSEIDLPDEDFGEEPMAAATAAQEQDVGDELPLEDDEALGLEAESIEDKAVRALESEEGGTLDFEDADLEDIPDLDQELAPEQIQKSQRAASRGEAGLAAAAIPEDDFDTELGSSNEFMSDAEESEFEAKLEASIDEESALLAKDEPDLNQSERQAALSMLEREPATPAKEGAKVQGLRKVKASGKAKDSFRLSGLSFAEQTMHLSFASGAYMEIDLSQLELHEARTFMVGIQEMVVTEAEEGYFLEIDGMKMFYPKTALEAAS